MPQDFYKYPETMQDRRRKLDPVLHEEIIRKYDSGKGGYSWKTLGQEYGVSKKLIGLIVNPAMKEKMVVRNKEKWQEYNLHYGAEYHRKAMEKWRANKRILGLSVPAPPRKEYQHICKECGVTFITINKTKVFHDRKCFFKNWNKKK